jgi:hypothetical protein
MTDAAAKLLGEKYCMLCRAEMPGVAACPEHPTHGPCATDYVPLPRENFTFEGGEPCFACGLPIPPKPYMFVCPKHRVGGWCFTQADYDRATAEDNAVAHRHERVGYAPGFTIGTRLSDSGVEFVSVWASPRRGTAGGPVEVTVGVRNEADKKKLEEWAKTVGWAVTVNIATPSEIAVHDAERAEWRP